MQIHHNHRRSVPAAVRLVAAAQASWATAGRNRGDRGQATAEYALVILGAAAMALLVVAWAAKTSEVSTLLNKVVKSVAARVA